VRTSSFTPLSIGKHRAAQARMTAPRRVIPGRFLFITRRCTQRQFLLRPDRRTNQAFLYCLAEAAARFDIQVVLSQMMSNHEHTLLYDPHGRQVEFRAHFYKMVAKVQNCIRCRWENLWATEEPAVVEILDLDDVLEKLVYIAINPVKDGLVERVHHWPGPNFYASLLSGRPMRVKRPTRFFSKHSSMPAEVELVLGLPDVIEDKQQFLDKLRRRVEEEEQHYARLRRRRGRKVYGRRAIRQQSWRNSPTTREPRRKLRPKVAARNKGLRCAMLQRNKEWLADYRAARTRWLAGDDVAFPYGTYWLRRFANVRVMPPPPAPCP
jgi:putative transposase